MLSVMIQKKTTDMGIDTLQLGTHPMLTPSPLGYGVIAATVDAIQRWTVGERNRQARTQGMNGLPTAPHYRNADAG
jgi:hypothetical protein